MSKRLEEVVQLLETINEPERIEDLKREYETLTGFYYSPFPAIYKTPYSD